MAAHQAPLSLGFSRQEHWSGLPFPSPMHESENEVIQSCPTLGNWARLCGGGRESILLFKFYWSLLLLLLSRFSRVRLCVTHRWQPTRLPRPWDSQGKNTGVGCHFLLQCVKVKSESEVSQSCLTLSDPMDCSPRGSSIHGILQARVLEWGAIAISTPPTNPFYFSCIQSKL